MNSEAIKNIKPGPAMEFLLSSCSSEWMGISKVPKARVLNSLPLNVCSPARCSLKSLLLRAEGNYSIPGAPRETRRTIDYVGQKEPFKSTANYKTSEFKMKHEPDHLSNG